MRSKDKLRRHPFEEVFNLGNTMILGAFGLAIVLLVWIVRPWEDPPYTGGSSDRHIMTVHRTASCGCCGDWIDYVAASNRFDVRVVTHSDLAPVRARLSVPDDLSSCHTAEVAGYVIEGHVPVPDIERLLEERPTVVGLALPGMVPNSPGMAVPDGPRPTFRTILFDREGRRSVFAVHRPENPA